MADIRVITEPKVYVIGRLVVDREAVAAFLRDTGYDGPPLDYAPSDAENLVEIGGRVCYRSFGRGRPHDDYIKHVLEVGHGSVTEHAVWTLLVAGVSRTCSHELVRHRHLSPSQESQRYVDASDVAFVRPPLVKPGSADDTHWKGACATALSIYRGVAARLEREIEDDARNGTDADHPLLCSWCFGHGKDVRLVETGPATARLDPVDPDNPNAPCRLCHGSGLAKGAQTAIRKQSREAARAVLPGCAETRLCLTGNARAWRNFVELRCSEHADAEMRRLANAVLDALAAEAPNLFGDYQRHTLPDGTFEAETEWRKV